VDCQLWYLKFCQLISDTIFCVWGSDVFVFLHSWAFQLSIFLLVPTLFMYGHRVDDCNHLVHISDNICIRLHFFDSLVLRYPSFHGLESDPRHDMVFFDFVLCISLSAAVGALLLFHTYLILSAQTTIEFYQNRLAMLIARRQKQVLLLVYQSNICI
jgi:hypothetical protein